MEYYAVDRVEGGYAVCEREDEVTVNISLDILPQGVREGNVLRRLSDGSFVIDCAEEERRRSEILALMQDLFDE